MKKQRHSKKPYLSIPEVASILGISRIAVYKKVKNGEIESIKIGRTYGIPKAYPAEAAGKGISSERKKIINYAVKKAVKEYGELLRKLGQE